MIDYYILYLLIYFMSFLDLLCLTRDKIIEVRLINTKIYLNIKKLYLGLFY